MESLKNCALSESFLGVTLSAGPTLQIKVNEKGNTTKPTLEASSLCNLSRKKRKKKRENCFAVSALAGVRVTRGVVCRITIDK